MNATLMIGRICNDLDLKHSKSGAAFVNFSIARRKKMKKDETLFMPCVAFGKTAEFITEYFKKGEKCLNRDLEDGEAKGIKLEYV